MNSETINEIKSRLIFSLVNTEWNEERLIEEPSRSYLDLSIEYRIYFEKKGNGLLSARVDNKLFEALNCTEEELYSLAYENTKRLMQPKVETMENILTEMMGEEKVAITEDVNMWVVSNQDNIFGAGRMLYEETFYDLSDRLGDDLYILPSSIHEVIVIPYSYGEPKDLAKTVKQINRDQVAPEERLSDNIYYYDRGSRTISLII